MTPSPDISSGRKPRLETLTWRMVVICLLVSVSSFTFGYDTTVFGGTQVMQPFLKRFGTFDHETKLYTFTPSMRSLMTSLPFLGKLVGTLVAGPFSERWGRKWTLFLLACVSLVGCLLQETAHTAAQFLVGRVINFGSIGITINVVPAYMAECTPGEWRGLFGSAMQFFIAVGGVLGSLGNYFAQKQLKGDAQWLVTTGVQLALPVIIVGGLPLIPESPRWLLSVHRKEDAVQSMIKLNGGVRTEEEVRSEVEMLSTMESNSEKLPWKFVFQGTNLRRTLIAVGVMSFQQFTGQAFVSQYSTVFYSQIGVSDPFLMTLAGNLASLGTIFIVFATADAWGRRPLLIVGGTLMSVFIFVLGGIGTKSVLTMTEKNAIVACAILFGASFAYSWAPLSYTVCAEAPHGSVREKTVQLATAISVIDTFLVAFTLPYLLNAPYAALGAKVGLIYGSICVVSVIFIILYVPEFKGRSLEEMDILFEKKLPAWKFKNYHITLEDSAMHPISQVSTPVSKIS